jgi:hypothetical protein
LNQIIRNPFPRQRPEQFEKGKGEKEENKRCCNERKVWGWVDGKDEGL